jgi:precorrin-8X/cobalt-precorrin-8 methylmutase
MMAGRRWDRPPLPEGEGTGQTLLARYGLPPSEVEARSLALVEQLAGPALPTETNARRVAVMMLYAAGDPGLAHQIRIQPRAVSEGVAALRGGSGIVTDVRMVAAAVERERLAGLGSEVVCALDQPDAERVAREAGLTRAAAAIELLTSPSVGQAASVGQARGPAPMRRGLDDGVVVIGTAPTALLTLLDAVDQGRARPALIIGTPVGLVAASEAKDELIKRPIPYVTVLGTRGGSAMAAAALNALLRLATGA